ncbi:MAG TPA: glycosyltransferase family 4 protein [Pyrinomonadaceae bacterium]|jgi:glycosyltransferase involved in cell wall biosynthesis
MKIVYLSPCGQLGGAEVFLLNMMASLRAAEPEWRLYLILSESGPLATRAAELGVDSTVLAFPPALAHLGDAGAGRTAGHQFGRFALLCKLILAIPSVIFYVHRLRRMVRKLSPDVVHANGFKMHVLGSWATPRRIPLLWHIHDYVSARPVMARLLRRCARHCSVAIANSRSVAEDMKAVCDENLNVQIIYNAVDLERFMPAGPALDLDTLAGLPPSLPGTVRVGMLATLARWKGHETFLRAMALVPASLPVRGYLTTGALYQTDGSQYSLAEIKRLIETLGLSHRIGLTDFVSQPAAAMRALDVVVHASTQPEPFGLVIAEGMACGRAVIASNTGGATELVEAEVNALTHEPGDSQALAHRIVELVTDAQLRRRLGAAGRMTAERRFDRARLAKELIPLYCQVTSPSN